MAISHSLLCLAIFHGVINNHIFIYSSVAGHLGCFYVLAIINIAAMNTWCMYLLELEFSFFLVIYPGVKLMGHRVVLEKAMAPHSSTLAWKIPRTEESGGLLSMGSLRVGHDWETLLSCFTFMHWRRKWQLTPVFLPGDSQGPGSLVGCHLWGCTELDTTEAT